AAVVRKPLPIFTKPSSGSRARPRSRRNRIPDPVGFISVDRDHVETAGRRYPIALQIMLGGENQLSLLGRRHAGSRTAVSTIGTQTHFDENQHVSVLHDQIDLAALAAKIALDR